MRQPEVELKPGVRLLGADRPDSAQVRRAGWVCFFAGVLFLFFVWVALGVSKSYPGDEERFIESSKGFNGVPSIAFLKGYEEMSTPLPFIYWGNWGAAFGYSLLSIRIATFLWGIGALYLLVRVLGDLTGNVRQMVGCFTLIVLNPYWWMMSFFGYTDIFGVVGLLMASLGLMRRNAWLTMIGVMIALLSRQYLVFALPAFFLMALSYYERDRKEAIRQVVAMVVGCAPLGLLVLLWGGLSPDNQMKKIYQVGYLSYKFDSLFLYVSLIGIYTFPIWAWARKSALPVRWEWLAAAAGFAACLMFKIYPSDSAIKAGFATVGIFDRTMHQAGLPDMARQIVWASGAAVGFTMIYRLGTLAANDFIKERRLGEQGFCLLMIAGFLVVMPLSYLHWEKYFAPVLPWVCAGVAAACFRREAPEVVG